MSWATRIEGTVTRSDGNVVSFAIHADLGWQQWGATTEVLGENVDIIDAMVAGLSEAGVEPRDENDDPEADEEGE